MKPSFRCTAAGRVPVQRLKAREKLAGSEKPSRKAVSLTQSLRAVRRLRLPAGYLIFRCTFLSRILGVLMMIAGVAAGTFLYPPLAIGLKGLVLPVAGLAEVALMLWLIVRGVKVARVT